MSDFSLSDCDDVAADIGVRRAVSTTRHIGLTGFWKLPHELQSRILQTACGPPVLPRRVTVGHRSDCTTTMLRLALSCKAFNRQMLPILYANVRLPLPSILCPFQRTLASRPALGRLVTRLHIGPDEEFRMSEWWPMPHTRLRSEKDTFTVHLTESTDDPRLPSWACSSHPLVPGVSFPSDTSGLWKDAHDAFEAASRDLDVELQSPGSSRSGENIGIDAWRVRVWELQAAMELWCLNTRVCDEEEEQRTGVKPAHGRRPQYPTLAVGRQADSFSVDGEKVLHVSRAALYERMSRKEALTNHFNHPLLSARSGLRWRCRGLGQTWHEGGRRRQAVQEGEDVADLFAWTSTPPAPDENDDFDFDADVVVPPSDLCDPLDEDIPPTATVGGNLALARTVLSLTPSVSSLSLTGFLERALVGSRPPCHQALRTVNLGPTAAGLSVPAHFEHAALHGVRRLRICGAPLDPPELDAIAGKGGALPRLRQVEWTPTTEWWDIWSDEIIRTIKGLLEIDDEAEEGSEPAVPPRQGIKRRRSECDTSSESPGSPEEHEDDKRSSHCSRRHRSLSISSALHRDDAAELLKEAPFNGGPRVWRNGERVGSRCHRLRIFMFRGWDEGPCSPLAMDATREMFDHGRMWWESG